MLFIGGDRLGATTSHHASVEVLTRAGPGATFDSEFQGKSTYVRDAGQYGIFHSKVFGTDSFGNFIIVDELGGANRQVVAFRPDLSSPGR